MSDVITVCLPEDFFKVVQGTFSLTTVQTISSSRFSPNAVRYGGPKFQRWSCSLDFAVQTREDWQKYEAWAANIEGEGLAFEVYDPSKPLPLGIGAGVNAEILRTATNQPFVDDDTSNTFISGGMYDGKTFCNLSEDAERYAQSILVDGLPVSSKVLKAGDNFSLGGNLYMVRGDCVSNASGQARIDFAWRLHKKQIAGDKVDLRKPKGRFIITEGGFNPVSKFSPQLGQTQLQAIELPYT